MASKDVLKEAIQAFDGTVIVVSHDREFLDGLVSKVYEFADGKVREHLGGIYDFLQKKNLDNLADIGRMKGAPAQQSQPQAVASAGKEDYEAKKEQERRKRKIQKKIEDCEKEVERISKEIKDIEEWLATPGGAQNPAMFEAYGKLKNDLAAAESRWEEAMMEGESI
jgi:ATP-binding cassette subfamily F protein 3